MKISKKWGWYISIGLIVLNLGAAFIVWGPVKKQSIEDEVRIIPPKETEEVKSEIEDIKFPQNTLEILRANLDCFSLEGQLKNIEEKVRRFCEEIYRKTIEINKLSALESLEKIRKYVE